MQHRTIRVELGPRSYDVLVGDGALGELGPRLQNRAASPGVLVVTDSALPLDLIDKVATSLASSGLRATWVQLEASERDKSLAAAQRVLEAAAAARLERSGVIVALGGGVIGDVAGFAASIYRRGVAVVQCPTTLLAMVDASVGGKTAVNLFVPPPGADADQPDDADHAARLLKNMVGTFHQPRLVIADVSALSTLPPRHLRAGLAECIKHAMLAADFGDPDFINQIAEHLPAIAQGQASPDQLTAFIDRNVAIKAAVVAGDEFESGSTTSLPADASTRAGAMPHPAHAGREALNLGHTFGHALESLEHLSPDSDPANAPLHHGEAVALGLIAATATAEAMNQIPAGSTQTVRGLVDAAGLPTGVAGLPADDAVIAAMMDDKKVKGGKLRLVLPNKVLGRVQVAGDASHPAFSAGIAAIRA